MKKYSLQFLPLFEEDLNQIVDYITFQLENPQLALSLVDDVYRAIFERLPHAESFEMYHSRKQRSLPY